MPSPEAQLDRFFIFKIKVDYPTLEQEVGTSKVITIVKVVLPQEAIKPYSTRRNCSLRKTDSRGSHRRKKY
jgi:MoxR-like ATPase